MRWIYSILTLLLLSSSIISVGQGKGEFQNRYLKAKNFYKAGEYEKALHAFKACTEAHQNNYFEEYGHYYCGLSAFKAQKWEDARFILVQLISKYPDWEQLDEARYLMANIAFEERDYNKSYLYLSQISDSNLVQEAEGMQTHYLKKERDVSALKSILTVYPHSRELANQIAHKLNESSTSIREKYYMEYLVQEYQLDSIEFGSGVFRSSEKKESYNVAVMLPFMFDEDRVARSAKYLEMLQGVYMAADSLKERGVIVNIHIYDTQRDSSRVDSFVHLPEMLGMDLLFGPVYPEPAHVAALFALSKQIHYINPLYSNDSLIHNNVFSYLAMPSYFDKARELAEYAIDSTRNGEVVILYGEGLKDSTIAHTYKRIFDTIPDKNVTVFKKITIDNYSDITDYIEKANNTEELSHILVSSSEVLAGAYTVTALEELNITVPVFAPEKWLGIRTNTFEQYKRRQVYFYTDDYVNIDERRVQRFRNAFKSEMGIKPIKYAYAYIGFDYMLLAGNLFENYGNLFHDELKNDGYQAGATTAGMDYSMGNSNGVFMLLGFDKDYYFTWLNKP